MQGSTVWARAPRLADRATESINPSLRFATESINPSLRFAYTY